MTLDNSVNNLAIMYLACIQSIVYQTRQIIETMCDYGMNFRVITVIGGMSNNQLYCQLLSDICNIPVLVSRNGESLVLLGSSILGASNSITNGKKQFSDMIKGFRDCDTTGTVLYPSSSNQEFHQKKYKVYLRMLEDQKDYMEIMN